TKDAILLRAGCSIRGNGMSSLTDAWAQLRADQDRSCVKNPDVPWVSSARFVRMGRYFYIRGGCRWLTISRKTTASGGRSNRLAPSRRIRVAVVITTFAVRIGLTGRCARFISFSYVANRLDYGEHYSCRLACTGALSVCFRSR